MNIDLKANGLHSGTKLKVVDHGNYKTEWHEHPETGELVELETWYVMDGDCVSGECEVKNVYPQIGCELFKLNNGYYALGGGYFNRLIAGTK